jgi:hypothetical protein
MTPFLHPYVPLTLALAPALPAVIPQGSSSSFAVAAASEIGPGFSPDIQPQPRTGALAPGTLPWEPLP